LRFYRDDRHISAEPCGLPLQILLIVGARHPDERAVASDFSVIGDPHAGRVGFILGGHRGSAARERQTNQNLACLPDEHSIALSRQWKVGEKLLRTSRS